jgi:endonuclease/exonuclease/phosphatase family metal-dependent hydrolase
VARRARAALAGLAGGALLAVAWLAGPAAGRAGPPAPVAAGPPAPDGGLPAAPDPGAAGPAPDARPVLRAVTLNLLHGGVFSGLRGDGQDLERRLQMVAEELRALDPDVVGLQEASAGRGRGNVAARLAGALGLGHVVHGPVVRGLARLLINFTEGPAILSRYPIVRWEAHDLPRCGRLWEPRVLVYAELATPWGLLPAFSTHTSGDPCHTGHVAGLVRERAAGRPALVMGDFNATEDSPAIRRLMAEAGLVDAFRAANPEAPGPTVWQRVDAAGPTVRRRVDFVFLAAGAGGGVLASRVVADTPRRLEDGRTLWPSDHYGVLADVHLPPAPPVAAPPRDPGPPREPGRHAGVRPGSRAWPGQ